MHRANLRPNGLIPGCSGVSPSTHFLILPQSPQPDLLVQHSLQALRFAHLSTSASLCRMANGKVDDLSWSQLRPRRADPHCVVDSIPPEDMQTFLRLMATNPFLPFNDASAVRSKISNLRQWRTDAANPNTITYVPTNPANSFLSCGSLWHIACDASRP